MKLVPFATRVRIDIKAFPPRLSVPFLITNSIVHHNGLFSRSRWHSNCVSYGSDVFSSRKVRKNCIIFCRRIVIVRIVLVRNCEDEPHLE
ncbi:hypothetical protein T02_8035 [Trichinella nativa]|uniref:Uncharacterized protein n=1 Tax=Trichinella nativa TaxID=6335 RepID=A0A0V1KMH6_9BILA|nr:hypothetical protein T02_8035 [Trichinella nativa]